MYKNPWRDVNVFRLTMDELSAEAWIFLIISAHEKKQTSVLLKIVLAATFTVGAPLILPQSLLLRQTGSWETSRKCPHDIDGWKMLMRCRKITIYEKNWTAHVLLLKKAVLYKSKVFTESASDAPCGTLNLVFGGPLTRVSLKCMHAIGCPTKIFTQQKSALCIPPGNVLQCVRW